MRQNYFVAVAAAAILSATMLGNQAEAMTLSSPAALGAVTAEANLVRRVAVVCGSNGCAPVQTSAPRRRPVPLAHGR